MIDSVDQFLPGWIEVAAEADAEEAVDHEAGGQGKKGKEFAAGGFGFGRIEQGDFAVGQVLDDLAGVIAVVSFAGEDDDGVAGAGELAHVGGKDVTDAANDLEGGAFGCPGAFFPVSHLGAADDGQGHAGEGGRSGRIRQARISWNCRDPAVLRGGAGVVFWAR